MQMAKEERMDVDVEENQPFTWQEAFHKLCTSSDLLSGMFLQFDIETLNKVQLVCREWHETIKNNTLLHRRSTSGKYFLDLFRLEDQLILAPKLDPEQVFMHVRKYNDGLYR